MRQTTTTLILIALGGAAHSAFVQLTATRIATSGGPTIVVAALDAPLNERRTATFRCDGNADEVEIQAAFERLRDKGGSLALSSGSFIIDRPIDVVGRVRFEGQGLGTIVKASNVFQGTALVVGDYAGQGTPLELFQLRDMTLDGSKFQGATTGGIQLNVTSGVGFLHGSPDAFLTLSNVLVSRCTGHGVHMLGSRNRAARIDSVRVWDVDGDGFRIESPDMNLTDCDAGSSGGAGLRIMSSNVIVSGCKAWYSDASGFVVEGVRGAYSGCSAQDNALHGFEIRAGMTTFASCHADSNSFLGGAMPDPHSGLYDGFHLAASHVIISASFAYDKNEGGRGRNQRFGTYVAPGRDRINVQVSGGNLGSHDNVAGGVGGDVAGPQTRIVSTGQTVLGW